MNEPRINRPCLALCAKAASGQKPPRPALWLSGLLLAAAAAVSAQAQSQARTEARTQALVVPTRVQVPSLETMQSQALSLPGYWFAAPDANPVRPAPAIVLLHGCGGALNRQGALTARMTKYSAMLNAEGWHVLVLDSLTPRGEREICTQEIGTRAITMTERRNDTLGALAWLAAQTGVDGSRLALLGWSNGGSAVLSSTNLGQAQVAAAPIKPRAAVAFYPGCEAELRRGYTPSASLLMLVGAADDWTPAAPCEALARQTGAPQPLISSYAGAFHGFDSAVPVRLRTDVPNGARPGAGVHVGGQAEALVQSREDLLGFLRESLQ